MDSFFLSETLVYLYLALAPPEVLWQHLGEVLRCCSSAASALRCQDLAQAMPWFLGASIFTTEGLLFGALQEPGSKWQGHLFPILPSTSDSSRLATSTAMRGQDCYCTCPMTGANVILQLQQLQDLYPSAAANAPLPVCEVLRCTGCTEFRNHRLKLHHQL